MSDISTLRTGWFFLETQNVQQIRPKNVRDKQCCIGK